MSQKPRPTWDSFYLRLSHLSLSPLDIFLSFNLISARRPPPFRCFISHHFPLHSFLRFISSLFLSFAFLSFYLFILVPLLYFSTFSLHIFSLLNSDAFPFIFFFCTSFFFIVYSHYLSSLLFSFFFFVFFCIFFSFHSLFVFSICSSYIYFSPPFFIPLEEYCPFVKTV